MKNGKLLIVVFAVFLAALAVALVSCSSSGGGDAAPVTETPGGAPGTTGMIMGTVKNTSDSGLADVTVTAVGTGLTTTTNDQGYYSLSGLAVSTQLTVNYSRAGHAPTSKITAIQASQSSYLTAVMAPVETFPVNAATGGTVTTTGGAAGTVPGGIVTIPANALVNANGTAYTGAATVTVATFDPTTAAGMNAFPGKFEGIQAAGGETVPIESYGFIDVNITDASGNKLQIASGKTATITIPIPSSLQAGAPPTMPLWYYDMATGQWKEEGTAALSGGGTVYTGTVSHFTPWNMDLPITQLSTVTGTVVDGSGNPILGARVEIKPISGSGRAWASGEDSTPANGTFSIRVMAGQDCEIWAMKNGIESDHKTFASAAAGGTYDVGNIVLARPLIKITLTWGVDPSDLDSHLTIPMADGSRSHVYYSDQTPAGADAYLDTDDTLSYGPEITTVTALHNGVYRYSVHHYSGSGTISSSGASISMFVEGFGIYNLTPPAGATAEDDVWQLWEITVAGGVVTAVTPLNTYIAGVSADAVTAPAFKGASKPALQGGNW